MSRPSFDQYRLATIRRQGEGLERDRARLDRAQALWAAYAVAMSDLGLHALDWRALDDWARLLDHQARRIGSDAELPTLRAAFEMHYPIEAQS